MHHSAISLMINESMQTLLKCYFFPAQILWIIPFEWLRWMLILVAMVISGSVLVLTFWPAVRDEAKLIAVATVVAILLLHTLLAVGCKVSGSQ